MDTGVGLAKRTGGGSWRRAERPGTNLSQMARRYDIDLRMLRRWKREVTQQAIRFVTVEIVEAQRDEAVS